MPVIQLETGIVPSLSIQPGVWQSLQLPNTTRYLPRARSAAVADVAGRGAIDPRISDARMLPRKRRGYKLSMERIRPTDIEPTREELERMLEDEERRAARRFDVPDDVKEEALESIERLRDAETDPLMEDDF